MDTTHADVLVLGTGVPEAVCSAAAARARKSVIHVDENDCYGSSWASLTLEELARHDGVRFPRAGDLPKGALPADLAPLNRHYALSLRPALLPAAGPMIEALVRSNVASYATFRLLEHVCIYDGELARVPGSKSEVFKERTVSLADKRRLMRFLERVAPAPDGTPAAPDAPDASIAAVIADTGLDARLQDALLYGVCMSWRGDERADTALARTAAVLGGYGRYGNSSLLVGQYGGAGELAQGFCRAAAVHGATFVLGHRVSSLVHDDNKWTLELHGVDHSFTANTLVGSADSVHRALGGGGASAHTYEHVGIIVLDAPLALDAEREPESALVVIPPHVAETENAVMVIMQGEGTFSCPKGHYVYHLVTHAASPNGALSKAAALVCAMTGPAAAVPLVEYFTSRPLASGAADMPHCVIVGDGVPSRADSTLYPRTAPAQPVPNPTETLDHAVYNAEDAFWAALGTQPQRDEARAADAARRAARDPSEYEGRGGVEPSPAALSYAELEFFAPRESSRDDDM